MRVIEVVCRIDDCGATVRFEGEAAPEPAGWTDLSELGVADRRDVDGNVVYQHHGYCPGHSTA